LKRLLLLGGGHAHVHVMKAIAQEPIADARLMMVTPFARQMYSGMVPGLVAGLYQESECSIPLAPLASAAGITLVEAWATALDADARRVTLSDGRVAEYDLLSIDTGPVMDREAIAGARVHGLFVRPIEHFVRLLPALWTLAGKRAIDLVVIGGGAAGFELALGFARRMQSLGDGASRIMLVTGGGEPLAGYPPALVRRAGRMLWARGITVLQEQCVGIDAGHVRLGNGARVACDAPVIAVGTAAPGWLAGSGLALDTQGFVATGPTLQSTSHPQVFAAGDVASRADAPHPRSGVYAVRAGPPLADNLRRAIGGVALRTYRPQARSLNLLSSADGRALLAWGPWSANGRWIWRLKDRIDRAFIARYVGEPAALSPAAGK
jgi:pyridine nucleotide-disulfide oxidoreductase family protein